MSAHSEKKNGRKSSLSYAAYVGLNGPLKTSIVALPSPRHVYLLYKRLNKVTWGVPAIKVFDLPSSSRYCVLVPGSGKVHPWAAGLLQGGRDRPDVLAQVSRLQIRDVQLSLRGRLWEDPGEVPLRSRVSPRAKLLILVCSKVGSCVWIIFLQTFHSGQLSH